MAFFGRAEDRFARTEGQKPPPRGATTAPERVGEVQAYLGCGSRIEGRLRFEGSVRIDGQVEGEIEAKDAVVIGETAVVVAQITAGTVVLQGQVTGDVSARERVELRAPGRLLGNIVAPTLVIQEGVIFEGHCSMAAADARSERPEGNQEEDLFPAESGLPAARAASELAK